MSSPEGGRLISDTLDNPLCKQALDIMLSTYGSEAGNVCLKYLPYGGLYIAGGIAPLHASKIVDPVKSEFLRAFKDKGRVASVLDKIKVAIVKVDDLGLRGSHFVANKLLQSLGPEEPGHQQHGQPQQQQQSIESSLDKAVYNVGLVSLGVFTVLGIVTCYKALARE
eukprot:TRINITY_DN6892_c0_g1_i9.p1 TRINITY_DN6892_c0_g1~~TRINITY_DN6892_c0_g1_i9.p1  ORF type:complete len:167 (+),score=29.92 TRINITY_DN6892_c0_g1_i9:1405-1905(+)